jgi:hypothetical protein
MVRHVSGWVLCGLLLAAGAGQAGEVVLKTPFSFVRIAGKDRPAPGLVVQTPYFQVNKTRLPVVIPVSQPTVLPQGEPVVVPPGQPVEVLPPPRRSGVGPVDPAPIVVPPTFPVRPPTHAEFASSFRPLPGSYEVVLLHPFTGAPVKACFNLPPGQPKKVRVERDELEFDYGRYEVEIRFNRDGRVSVEYND